MDKSKLKVLDLFSGLGGFSLGLERAGFETVAFCEIEKYTRQQLKKNFPGIPVYENVETIGYERLAANGIIPNVIVGGFPCQDISIAGKGAGIEGIRSSLWKEYYRLICEIRPSYAIVENSAALTRRGLSVVLGDLAKIGYRTQWDCIPACAVGANHERDRIWIVTYPNRNGIWEQQNPASLWNKPERTDHEMVNPKSIGRKRRAKTDERERAEILQEDGQDLRSKPIGPSEILSNSEIARLQRRNEPVGNEQTLSGPGKSCWPIKADWSTEPNVGMLVDGLPIELSARIRRKLQDHGISYRDRKIPRVATGIPNRTNKIKAIGNGLVRLIPELIGRAIMEISE